MVGDGGGYEGRGDGDGDGRGNGDADADAMGVGVGERGEIGSLIHMMDIRCWNRVWVIDVYE